MSEEKEEKVEKKDFSRYEGLDPKEWSSIAGGIEYKKYLKKAERENRVKELSDVQKQDLKNLNQLEKDGQNNEDDKDFDESAIDFGRLKTPMDVAFYLCFPEWILSQNNKNIKRFVENESKTKSIFKISRESEAKWKKQNGISNDDKNKRDSEQEEQVTGKKPSLWRRFVIFCKKSNEKELGTNVSSNSRQKASLETSMPMKNENKPDGLENAELGEE